MTEKVCKDLLRKHHGRVAAVAEEAEVSRAAVYIALRRHNLWSMAVRMRAGGLKAKAKEAK